MNSVSVELPAQEALGLGVEVVELALEDRDDVAWDVLANLGVLERSLATDGGAGLHGHQCSGIGWQCREARTIPPNSNQDSPNLCPACYADRLRAAR